MRNQLGDEYSLIKDVKTREALRAKYAELSGMSQYTEVKRPDCISKEKVEDTLIWSLIEKISVDLSGDWTCPVKVFVIYGHDEDISYDEIYDPQEKERIEIKMGIKREQDKQDDKSLPHLLSKCTDKAQLFKLRECYPNIVPRLIDQSESDRSSMVVDTVFFDQRDNQRQLRPICWVRIPNLLIQRFEVVLPQRIAMKYVTAHFIESDASVAEQYGDQREPNVDCRKILLYGRRLKFENRQTGKDIDVKKVAVDKDGQ